VRACVSLCAQAWAGMWAYGQASGARARGMRECACAGMGAGVGAGRWTDVGAHGRAGGRCEWVWARADGRAYAWECISCRGTGRHVGAGVCGSGQMGRRAGMHPCNILDGWRAHLQESDPNTYPKELDGCRANKPVRILQTFRNGRNGDPNAPRNPATNSLSIPTGE